MDEQPVDEQHVDLQSVQDWDVRPLTPEDLPAAALMLYLTFTREEQGAAYDETAALAAYPPWPVDRLQRALRTDPGSVVVAGPVGAPTGVALAQRRGGLWVLSMLAVAHAQQGTGVGSALLASLAPSRSDATALAVASSNHPAALRAYLRLGMDLHPALRATGRVDSLRLDRDAEVRPGRWRRHAPHVAACIEAARGFPAGPDVAMLAERGDGLVVSPHGFAAWSYLRNSVQQVAASSPDAARLLLHGVLARMDPRRDVTVSWLTGNQPWAMRACIDVGLALAPHGAVGWSGAWDASTAYLPNNANL